MPKNRFELPRPERRSIRLADIQTDEDNFQPRFGGARNDHIARLVDAIGRSGQLDPIAVWEDPETSDKYVVADGHHRLEAYRRHKGYDRIVAEVYRCDSSTAKLLSVQENTKTRLALTYQEKANWAWRRTCEGGWSKKQLALVSGISERTVGTMRSLKRKLIAMDEVLPDSWLEARDIANGTHREWTDQEREQRIEEAVAKADEKYGADLASLCQRFPDAAAELLRRCAGHKLEAIADSLGYQPLMEDIDLDEFPF
ncbi:ParB N-terminal domain-containing protein [Roseivivax sp. GX 12232]|uniref:ParB/RepB/Spo0J family partition protein n=1 Tax=Roseivivax sp. GX 12232 TaxID=2900547 RepID=UPI001E2F1B1A|nr:ParB N-terminal domain-containing protein [Roseivivax sp. GX 12232]MCE0504135.1 ParB N-terminal domain-containing protein [Roseivivax sp. GX 12232]